ncbi:Phosphoglycerate mutase-like protein 1 [Vitis vinifera]|uniref:Phosphoglycerate mutase-like protein 1 n=1 Tax=Vitis vinifera TaxID=29760 RepID=A0A438JMS1_VITVI|nr:Phosphoglycerate mutase-like protein 1 [Vitis vinifera]
MFKQVFSCCPKCLERTVFKPVGHQFKRTMQTAVGVFGGEGYKDRMDVLPLMVANAGECNRSAISSLDSPPFLAVELCREHLVWPIQKEKVSLQAWPIQKGKDVMQNDLAFSIMMGLLGKGLGSLLGEFILVIRGEASATISFFSLPLIFHWQIESDEDILWKANVRETNEEVAARGLKFMNWLWTRKEKEIAIVTHSGFLFHTLNAFGNDCHPLVKTEICKHFANCELRSMIIVDRSMAGSDSSTTNYPGKIPPGLDLPSDIADGKLENEARNSGLT